MSIRALCLGSALVLRATVLAQAPANSLTPDQQQRFKTAQLELQAGKFTQALADMRSLLADSPDSRALRLGTAETALDAGQAQVALDLLKAYEAKHPEDWLAMTFETRAYAETGQPEKRDELLGRLLAMHKTTTDPHFKELIKFLVERVRTDRGHVDVYYLFEPRGRYNIYATAYLYDSSRRQFYQVTLESSDLDQTSWSKSHPDLATKGMRVFTIDGYSNGTQSNNGTSTQTHATFAFLDGQPSYDAFRERALNIAAGKGKPLSTTTIGIP